MRQYSGVFVVWLIKQLQLLEEWNLGGRLQDEALGEIWYVAL